jgi:5,10-methenyltetrahydrofolate synthetase
MEVPNRSHPERNGKKSVSPGPAPIAGRESQAFTKSRWIFSSTGYLNDILGLHIFIPNNPGNIVTTSYAEKIKSVRKQLRAELVHKRMEISDIEYLALNAAISQSIVEHFKLLQWMKIGFYWPFQGEFDPLHAIAALRVRGTSAALPVIVEKNHPLKFFEWFPAVKMANGIFNIPVPVDTEEIVPNALLIPMIGFDASGYRLGYGGGYYDRTLAALNPQPLKIGLAFEVGRISSIDPKPHDIPMDFIVTEKGVHHVNNGKIELIDDAAKTASLISALVNLRAVNFAVA